MLLQGDELAVQLFIGAAALTALSVAMTQAGWTHRWFVRGMFALAAFLTVACVGWPYFESRIPLINEALQTVALSRIGWFFIGITPAFVGGMVLSDFLRRRRKPNPRLATAWKSITFAMLHYARQDLIDRYEYVIAQSAVQSERKEAIDAELAKSETVPSSQEEQETLSFRVAAFEAERMAIDESFKERQDRIDICRDVLRENIHNQLKAGSLLAKGFLSPHTPSSPEIIIPAEEWRFLMLEDMDERALGPNFDYIAVLIAKP